MLVLVGKSCTGKNTIQKKLVEDYGMERVVTYTTRPPRDGEVDGVDYHFLNCDGETLPFMFAELTEYHVASGETWYYGSTLSSYEDSDNKVIILNPEGLKTIKKNGINVFAVEITASETEIKIRQFNRGDDPEEAERRFAQDILDFSDIGLYVDTCVINWGSGGADRCARNIYQVYQHWLKMQKGDDGSDAKAM